MNYEDLVKEFEGADIQMELTEDIMPAIVNALDIEIEVLQGTKEPLPDGRTRYKFFIADYEKAMWAKEFALKMISKSHLQNGN